MLVWHTSVPRPLLLHRIAPTPTILTSSLSRNALPGSSSPMERSLLVRLKLSVRTLLDLGFMAPQPKVPPVEQTSQLASPHTHLPPTACFSSTISRPKQCTCSKQRALSRYFFLLGRVSRFWTTIYDGLRFLVSLTMILLKSSYPRHDFCPRTREFFKMGWSFASKRFTVVLQAKKPYSVWLIGERELLGHGRSVTQSRSKTQHIVGK